MFVCLTKIMTFSEGIEQSWTQEKMDALVRPPRNSSSYIN